MLADPDGKLLQAVVGNLGFAQRERLTGAEVAPLHVYKVTLPLPAFRGFPTDWMILIAVRGPQGSPRLSGTSLLDTIHQLLKGLRTDDPQSHVLLLSDDPEVGFGDEFAYTQRVFALDYGEVTTRATPVKHARNAPIVAAVRKQVESRAELDNLIQLSWIPYTSSEPVSGWRFFGRERELALIVERDENVIVMGARKIGKTSLMSEAARRLRARGDVVHFIDVQHCVSQREVIHEIVRTVDPRLTADVVRRRAKAFDESVFTQLLRQLSRAHKRTTLFLDEIGTVIDRSPDEDWSLFGRFRNFSHGGNVRIVMSCFQEFLDSQATDFKGPLVNYGRELRLGVLREAEIESFAISPLEFWRDVENRSGLLQLVLRTVGGHPLLLGVFCSALLHQAITTDLADDLLAVAQKLVRNELAKIFYTCVEDLFLLMPSSTVRYLFLKRCHDVALAGLPVSTAEIDDDWVEKELADCGFRSTTFARRRMFEQLELRGLTTSVEGSHTRQAIAAPVIYHALKQAEKDPSRLIQKYRDEIALEMALWDLRRLATSPTKESEA